MPSKPTRERHPKAATSFRIDPELLDELAALSRATKRSQTFILETGLRIMIKRARDMGILPAEGEGNGASAPTELATPQLRAV